MGVHRINQQYINDELNYLYQLMALCTQGSRTVVSREEERCSMEWCPYSMRRCGNDFTAATSMYCVV